jgi:hypothetical protein
MQNLSLEDKRNEMSLSKKMQSGFLERSLSKTGWLLLASIMPFSAGILLGVPKIALGNFTDSVFYLSYARQFSELVLRFGFPYYATRFGGILSDALSGQLFGDIVGIWVLRWCLAAVVSGALFLCFKKRYGILVGLLASVLWSFNPAVMRLMCTTYVDSTAVPFLILGGCLVIAGWGGRYGLVVAGCLFALAASAHLYAGFALILLIPLLIGSRWNEGWKRFGLIGWVVMGFGTTFGIAWLWYWAVWGMPSLFGPTNDLMRDLGHGQAAQWKKPTALALHEVPAWFAPLALIVPLGLAALRGSPLVRGGGLSLLLSIGFFWGGDLFGSAYVLSMPFYYSFLLPVVILAAAILCSEIVRSQSVPWIRGIASASLALATIVPALSAAHSLERIPLAYGGVIGVLCLLLVVWKNLSKRLLVILSVAALGASVWMTASTGIFRQILGYYQPKDIPVLELASALKREVPMAWSDTKVTRFWYDDDLAKEGSSDRRMIGSFWLHTFGKLTGDKESLVPCSIITTPDAEAITSSGVERIVIFDQKSAEVDQALKKIEESRLPFFLSKRITLHAKSDPVRVLEVAVLERQGMEKRGELTELDLSGIRCGVHEKLQLEGGKALLTMSSNKWWNQAKLALPAMNCGDRLRVRVRIKSGFVRFILGDEALQFEEHTDRWPSEGLQEVILTAPMDLSHPELGMRSCFPNHSQSSLRLEVVEIEKPIQ